MRIASQKPPVMTRGLFCLLFSIYPILVMLIIFKIVLPIQNLLYYEKRIEFNFTPTDFYIFF